MIQDLEDKRNKSISLSSETLLHRTLFSKLQIFSTSGNGNSLVPETVSVNLTREIVATKPRLWAL